MTVDLRGFAGPCRSLIWNAATAKIILDSDFTKKTNLQLGPTPADLLILVMPTTPNRHQNLLPRP